MDESMTADAITAKRIDRRTAMKAAIGGAAAATAMTAPGISGFSFAPDFAAAASQCPAGTTVAGSPATISRTRITCGFLNLTACWGNGCCVDLGIGSITVNAASGSYNDPAFAFTVGGQVRNNNGRVYVTVTNFTQHQPFSSCTINVTGNCGGDTFSVTDIGGGITGTNTVITANASLNGRIRCSGSGTGSATVTVAASCICTTQ
jgi:hypothetical protein